MCYHSSPHSSSDSTHGPLRPFPRSVRRMRTVPLSFPRAKPPSRPTGPRPVRSAGNRPTGPFSCPDGEETAQVRIFSSPALFPKFPASRAPGRFAPGRRPGCGELILNIFMKFLGKQHIFAKFEAGNRSGVPGRTVSGNGRREARAKGRLRKK